MGIVLFMICDWGIDDFFGGSDLGLPGRGDGIYNPEIVGNIIAPNERDLQSRIIGTTIANIR